MPEFGLNPPAQICNQLRHGLNVASRAPEIHNAEPQSVPAGDHSIRKECLAAFLYGFQKAPIQFVQVLLRLFTPQLSTKFWRNVA